MSHIVQGFSNTDQVCLLQAAFYNSYIEAADESLLTSRDSPAQEGRGHCSMSLED